MPPRSYRRRDNPPPRRRRRPERQEDPNISNGQSPNITEGSLDQRLRNARIKCPVNPHAWFIPLDKQEELLSTSVIEEEIRKGDGELRLSERRRYAKWTNKRAKRLFMVLAYMRMSAWISLLLDEGIFDKDLPLKLEGGGDTPSTLRRKSGGEPIKTFKMWNSDALEEFDRSQWWMIAPKFDKESRVCHELADEDILPFIPIKEKEKSDKRIPHMKIGGYSEVTAFRIHPAHHNFWGHSIPLV